MRALKVLVVVMGVMIVVGTVTLGVLIAKKVGGGAGSSAQYESMGLGEAVGTRIVGIAGIGDRLALLMNEGDRSWVVVVDPKTNAVTGRIYTGAMAKPANPGP